MERSEDHEGRQNSEKNQNSERRYFHLYHNATDGLFTVDHDGYLHDANKMCELITGYSSKELEKTHFTQLLSDRDKRFISHYFGMIKKGQLIPRDDVQIEINTKQGQKKAVELHIQNAIFENGLIQASIRDVTEQQRLRDQLINAQRMECIGKLVNEVSHKFNDILTGILGSASYLRDSLKEDGELYKYVETIEKSASMGAELISQLMAFGNRQELYDQLTDMNGVVREALRLMHSRHLLNRIEIVTHLPDRPLSVRIDKGQIMQAIFNILHNAKDAMPGGGILTIALEKLDLSEDFCIQHIGLREGQYVHLRISDTGCGIEEKSLPYIFDPFFTTKDVGKGTGLGLSMAFGIIKSHQGTILVESRPGAGTNFDIYLPAHSSISVKDNNEYSVTLGEGTLMIVEDEELVRRMTFNILNRCGYNVFCAADGVEAIELYKEKANLIDLVILDMLMPRKDGLETFKELKNINKNIQVIISTGYLPNHASSEFLKWGAMGFIQKPYTALELSKLVKRILP